MSTYSLTSLFPNDLDWYIQLSTFLYNIALDGHVLVDVYLNNFKRVSTAKEGRWFIYTTSTFESPKLGEH